MYICNYSDNNGTIFYVEVNTKSLVKTSKDKKLHKTFHDCFDNSLQVSMPFTSVRESRSETLCESRASIGVQDNVETNVCDNVSPIQTLVSTSEEFVDCQCKTQCQNQDKERVKDKFLLRCHVKTRIKVYYNNNFIYNFDSYNHDNTLYCEEMLIHEFKEYLKMAGSSDFENVSRSTDEFIVKPNYDADDLFADFFRKYQQLFETNVTIRVHKDLLLYELTAKLDNKSGYRKYTKIIEAYTKRFSTLLSKIYFETSDMIYFNTLASFTLNHRYNLMRVITPDKYHYMLFEFNYLPTKIIISQNLNYVYFTTIYASEYTSVEH